MTLFYWTNVRTEDLQGDLAHLEHVAKMLLKCREIINLTGRDKLDVCMGTVLLGDFTLVKSKVWVGGPDI